MQNILAMILLLVCTLACPLTCAADEQEADLAQFIIGTYRLIGKNIEASTTYLGSATIARSATGLTIRRTIEARTVVGTVVVTRATPDAIPVVRIRYADRGREMEQTCLINSDLDNDARLTCQVYVPGKATDDPGLEAYFPAKERSSSRAAPRPVP